MKRSPLQTWEERFRNAAKADKMAALRNHLELLDIWVRPQLLLEGTIQVVRACAAYATVDGEDYASFLAMQTYEPSKSLRAMYALTLNLCDKGFARVLLGGDLRGADLADLYGHPWQKYKRVGYYQLWLSCIDRQDFTSREARTLERAVLDDLYYDYDYKELQVCTEFLLDDDENSRGILTATLTDLGEVVCSPRVLRSCRAQELLAKM